MSNKNIHEFYTEWANSLDSAGKDSTTAQARAGGTSIVETLVHHLATLVYVGQQLDLLKKYIYYGKVDLSGILTYGPHLIPEQTQAMSQRLQDHETIRLLHAVLGMAGEIAEIAEPLALFITTGMPIDKDNIREELGDMSWYSLALGSKWLGDPDHTQILESNYNKLTARYPEGAWTQDRAINRDLEKERKALEIRGLSMGGSEDGKP